jgi:hypothetical protein
MGETDRELMNEDDTQSFEALELRLKTPMRPTTKSKVYLENLYMKMIYGTGTVRYGTEF